MDYDRSGECAAGTGSFLDQQALRMQYSVEEVGAGGVRRQLRGADRRPLLGVRQERHDPRAAEGLFAGRNPARPVRRGGAQFQELHREGPAGGGAGGADRRGVAERGRHRGAARGVLAGRGPAVRARRSTPGAGAIGAAILEAEEPRKRSILEIHRLRQHDAEERVQDTHPLSTENVVQLRDRVGVYVAPADGGPIPAYLGLDIGSVSTNVVAIDEFGTVIHDVYLRTAGRPIEAVQQGLAEVEQLWGSRLEIRGVGTTGSGRELIAEFVGADVVNDEITAHKTGAIHISNTLGGEPVDTIFEIGGQDSKFISIENGVVVDFAMNEACAAGTGSFLEEQAEKLGISIKGEFAKLALSSRQPHAPGRALHGLHGARRHRLAAQGRDRAQPGGRPGLLHRAQLPEPRGARPQDRQRDLLPGRHRLQRRRHRGLRQPAGQEDHGAAVQRRDGRHRHGADRAPVARRPPRGETRFRGYDLRQAAALHAAISSARPARISAT